MGESNVEEAHAEEAEQVSSEQNDAEEPEAEGAEVSDEKEEAAEEGGAEEGADAEEDAESDEKALKISVDDVRTAPMDFRFPTTNQAKHCFTRYNEYHKCIAEKGEGASECNKYAKYYRSLCPGEWVERWNEQRASGTYAGRY